MKSKIFFLALSLFIVVSGNCQFIPLNINYPNTPYGHYPRWISIVDESNVWLGTLAIDSISINAYSFAVKTTDGGNTWEFDSIPVPGQPYMTSLFAVDANTCFYVFSDNEIAGGSIWKTIDGGANWAKKTTDQFSEPGGFADFYCAFDANEGVALGDPTLGYFEILRTTNGGDTWSRVDSSLIPPIIEGEWGATNAYSVLGDNIWFPSIIPDTNGTYSSRCFKSMDRGQHWTVSPVIAEQLNWGNMDFSTAQKGAFWDPYFPIPRKQFYLTSDGGNTWIADSLPDENKFVVGMSAVSGFDGGFVLGVKDTISNLITVMFTPDFFSTTIVMDSDLDADPWALRFKDATTGWLGGSGADTNSIFKYTGLLTAISTAAKSPEKMAIMPNPASTEALVKLPGINEKGDLILMIYDISGKLLENRKIENSTGWTKLNASAYSDGVYVVQVASGDQIVASTKWIVRH